MRWRKTVIAERLSTTTGGGAPVITVKKYAHGPGIDEPLAVAKGNSVYYYHADGVGSIVAITNNTEATVEGYTYETFGKFQRFGNAVMNTYGFTGREYDEETGLYYYRARYYDPETGRFISKDPIGFAGGDANQYNYVLGDPINKVDPLGLDWVYYISTNTLYQTDAKGNFIKSWPAISGPWGKGALEPGTYIFPSPPVSVPSNNPNQSAFCDKSGNCWWQPITPTFSTSRSRLGIHPDGNVPGTKGCIGATNSDTSSLKNALTNDQGPLMVR